ncbi:hypothetical protein KR009_009135 [Drosophila setifemur]|nr:hypothetical protein KR009_009135 [Drosophila setifemur]
MTTVHSHHTKVATSGAMSTESVKGFGSRHLTASPELPGLRERSSKSKNKFLYDLSVQLKDGEKRPTKRVYEFEQNQAKGYESDWSSSSLKSIKESPSVKSTTQKSLKKPKSPSAPAIRCIRRTPSFSAKREPDIPNRCPKISRLRRAATPQLIP